MIFFVSFLLQKLKTEKNEKKKKKNRPPVQDEDYYADEEDTYYNDDDYYKAYRQSTYYIERQDITPSLQCSRPVSERKSLDISLPQRTLLVLRLLINQ